MLFLGGVGYLVASGVTKDSVYFLNVGEALATDAAQLKQARLFGNVAAEAIEPMQPGPRGGLHPHRQGQPRPDPCA